MGGNKEGKKLVGLSSDDVEEKLIKYYSSHHQILLVGEGDFSFSLCIAQSFGSAVNIVASSLDTYDQVVRKYKKAKSNLDALTKLGAFVLHGVDATQMKFHPGLFTRRFDRIIFNFPHAGFHGNESSFSVIQKHRKLVHGFFMNARTLLKPDGEIHINHKTTPPFDDWGIEELGIQNLLWPIECVEFKKKDYPGYNNKRGDGPRCDEPFPLGQCSTFKFALLRKKESNPRNQRILSNHHYRLRSPLSPQSTPSLTSCRNGHLPSFGEGGGGYLNREIAILGRDGFDHLGGTASDLQKSTVFRHPETENAINIDTRLEKQVSGNVHGTSFDLKTPLSSESSVFRHAKTEHGASMDTGLGKQVSGNVHGTGCDLKRPLLSESSVFRHAKTEHGASIDTRLGKPVSGYVHRIGSELQRSQRFEPPEFRYPQTEHRRNMDVIRGRSVSEYVNGIGSDFQSLEGEDGGGGCVMMMTETMEMVMSMLVGKIKKCWRCC